MRKLVLFDIDGTILLTAGAGRRAIVAAVSEEVGDSSRLKEVRFDGKTDPQIVVELLEAAGRAGPHRAERISALCARYVDLLEQELRLPAARTTVMPGVHRLLDSLEAEQGVVLGLLTGNMAAGATLKLSAAGLDPSRFRVGAYGSDAAHRPDLPPIAARRAERYFGRVPSGSDVVIIGDTPADIACGGCISARAVGVATGAYSVEDLADCGPHAVFENLSDTDRVLEAILG
ncbi:MAG TPA: haloacid dehalogenase-like hydrolase [Gemmatimonadales bacterium]|nr:haloacid dehalogenase-like hydrolase [Gemmatimonadales bacterium]